MPPPDTDLVARVRAGMAFLDERLGAEWEEQIDLERLDIGDGTSCVLGQLWKWTDISAAFGGSRPAPTLAELGFFGFNDAALTAEWRAQLAARRAAKEGTE